MKKWLQNIASQLDQDNPQTTSEVKATLVYILDSYAKYLMDTDKSHAREVRVTIDEFLVELVKSAPENLDKTLFRLRQYFSTHRLEEFTYIESSLNEFRNIIWDFVNQLAEDIDFESAEDAKVYQQLNSLKGAVETNSIEELKNSSRRFIDTYVESQTRKEQRKNKKIDSVSTNLKVIKKQLADAQESMSRDHLTNAFNRKSYEEFIKRQKSLLQLDGTAVSLIAMDIDHFKKFNDTYGHAIGDFILVECVKILNQCFAEDGGFVARTGGEEFCVVLPKHNLVMAEQKAKKALETIQKMVFVEEGHELRFTMSMGVAELQRTEAPDVLLKRADEALYASKNNGRNRVTTSSNTIKIPA